MFKLGAFSNSGLGALSNTSFALCSGQHNIQGKTCIEGEAGAEDRDSHVFPTDLRCDCSFAFLECG